MRRRILGVSVAVVVFILPMAVRVAPAGADAPNDLLGLVNNLRGSLGRASLATNATLTNTAQLWAQRMAASQTLSHNPNLTSQVPSGWTKVGENIGYGGSLTAVYDALVASPPHYANMIDPAYNLTGIGVATDASGEVWVTEDFEAGPAPAPAPPPPTPANFTRPTTGATNVDTTVAFAWTAAQGAGAYYLMVGTSPGGADLVNSGVLQPTQTSYQVPALPSGQTLWARIYSYLGGNWNSFRDASFTAAASQATFIRPTNGTTMVNTTVPFSWTAVPGAAYYYLMVGSTLGGSDLVNSGLLTAAQTSFAIPALPTGKTLFARVYTYIRGSWNHFSDAAFTAAPVQLQSHATFLYPTNGTTTVRNAVLFSWTTVAGGGNYWLLVGTSEGGSDVWNSGILPGTQSSATVAAAPTGRVLWGRIYTYNGGLWNYSEVTFSAA